MTSMNAIAAVGLMILGAASSADAYKFDPAKTRITAMGPASATLNGVTLNCTGKFRVSVNKAGRGRVIAVSFSGARACKTVGVSGLPWAIAATGSTTAAITNASFTSNGGPCGPANMAVTVGGGVIGYNAAFDQCSQVTLSLATTPTLSIVP